MPFRTASGLTRRVRCAATAAPPLTKGGSRGVLQHCVPRMTGAMAKRSAGCHGPRLRGHAPGTSRRLNLPAPITLTDIRPKPISKPPPSTKQRHLHA